jgi:hypothetical protein
VGKWYLYGPPAIKSFGSKMNDDGSKDSRNGRRLVLVMRVAYEPIIRK